MSYSTPYEFLETATGSHDLLTTAVLTANGLDPTTPDTARQHLRLNFPDSNVDAPSKGDRKPKKVFEVVGTAKPGRGTTPAPTDDRSDVVDGDVNVDRVEIALNRIGGTEKKPKCEVLRDLRSRFKEEKPVDGECATVNWIELKIEAGSAASEEEGFELRLKRGLPEGRYALYSSATTNVGIPEFGFSAKDGNLREFKVG